MRLASRAFVVALAAIMLCAAVSAQTLRDELDPRNIAPTVGTGGPTGGPTGLFTIYDGQTLRRGEFTFSIAYSNYDRDPGNVDLTEVPVSFQVGINDYLELFFNTDAFRGIKVNNPANLSGFYLPNINPRVGVPSRNSPAIILSPVQNQVNISTTAPIFRPANSQPFVPFPFVGGPASNLGLSIPPPGARFGVPGGLQATLGARSGGESGNFGAADLFPGVGSPVGGILPGIVLTTRGIPPNLTFAALTVPDLFTIEPSYLPDAPFIGRTYGTSAFNTFNVGAKWRWTGPNNPFGIGIVAAYRFYADSADDAGGFNMLQRGASPGGDIGDFNLTLFLDGRLSRSVNMSVNFGYWLNSNPQSEAFGGGKFSLLDRPDEFFGGVGFDFPVNRYFQPIAELRFTQYVGGIGGEQTPNAFQNNPVDGLLGFRAFPARWVGFSAAYRRHLNQQNARRFQGGLPAGFRPSEDANGFLGQFFIGHRNERLPAELPNQPPTVTSFTASSDRIVLPANCGPGERPDPNCTPTVGTTETQVQLTTVATDPDGDTLLYTYNVSGGRIVGEGPNVTWDLSGAQPGTYTANVEVDDGCGCVAFTTVTVTVETCPCVRDEPPCPTISVSCPDSANPGQTVTFTASLSETPAQAVSYNWTVSAGTIVSGQGTSQITVDTTGLAGRAVTATVEVEGLDARCARTNECTTSIIGAPEAQRFDEYGPIAFNDEKARLDNYAIQLQSDPSARGVIIAYGGRRGRQGEALARANRARDYLVNTRGVDPGRIETVDGGFRDQLTVELWIVPSGAPEPTASPTVDPSEVQIIRGRATPRRPRRRR